MENDETKMIVGDLNQINVKVRSKLLDIKSQVNSIEELEEINNEVRSSFKQFESKLEQLSICSEEAPSKSSREAIESDFNSYKSLLASLRTALRKANVECHAEIEKVSGFDLQNPFPSKSTYLTGKFSVSKLCDIFLFNVKL